jgi:hypothetical protein
MGKQSDWVHLNLLVTDALLSMRWRVKDLTNEEVGYLAEELTDLLVNQVTVSEPESGPVPSSDVR